MFPAFQFETVSSPTLSRPFETESSPTLLHSSLQLAEIMSDLSQPRLDHISNTPHFDIRGSTASRGMNGIVAVNNPRLERIIDGYGMCGSIRHPTNDCLILQEPPLLFRPQQMAMHNMQFPQKESSLRNWTKQMPISNMEFQEDMCTTLQDLQDLQKQIVELTATINQLHSQRFGRSPSQTILNPQEETMSDTIVKSGNEMVEIDNCVPTISDPTDVVKIANFVTTVTDLTNMPPRVESLVEILDKVTRAEIADPVGADANITDPMCTDAKIANPRYTNDATFANRVEDADSMVDKSDGVNMTRSVDSMVEGLDVADKIAISGLADFENWKRTKPKSSNDEKNLDDPSPSRVSGQVSHPGQTNSFPDRPTQQVQQPCGAHNPIKSVPLHCPRMPVQLKRQLSSKANSAATSRMGEACNARELGTFKGVEFKLISIYTTLHNLAHIFHLHGGARCLSWCVSRLGKHKSWTERPKSNLESIDCCVSRVLESKFSAKHECHNSRPQDANRTVSQYYEPVTVGRIQQPTLTNHSKSKRECESSHVKKWKSIAIASITAVVEISGCRL
ncbi:hypothetical protein CR513_28587, partial [Mucuna pruriens]